MCVKNAKYTVIVKQAARAQIEPRRLKKRPKLEKRAFSLPYVSHNLHYTKM